MFRRSLHLLALGAVAALSTGSQAAAGSCCACNASCAPAQVIEVVEAPVPPPAPFYVVDQGPIYAGPGIVSLPTTHKVYRSIAAYPYIGRGPRYDHGHHPRVVLWQQSRVFYPDVKGPRRTVLSHSHRMTPYRSAPRRLAPAPLDPRDK
jgi:hypothetical protein